MKAIFSNEKAKVLSTLVVVSVLTIGVALVIAVARPIITEYAILLIQKYLSPDGIISQETQQKIGTFFIFGIYGLFILGSVGVLYWLGVGYIWNRLSDQSVHRERAHVSPFARVDTYLLAVVLFTGLVVYLRSIGRGFYYDELFSAYHFVNVDTVWETMSRYIVFNNHIFYSILSRIAVSIFGQDEWVLRLPALLFGLLSLVVLYRFIRHEYPRSVAFLATLLLAVNFSYTYWSVSARGYTGLIFFGLVSNISFLSLLNSPSKMKWIIHILSSVLGIYIHLYAISLILVQLTYLVLLLWRQPGVISRNSFQLLAFSYPIIGAIISILYIPVLDDLIRNLSVTGTNAVQWVFPINLINEFSGNTGFLIAVFVFIGFLIGLVYQMTKIKTHGLFFLFLILIPLLLIWLVIRPTIIYPRFFAYFLPYYIWFFSVGGWVIYRWMQRLPLNRSITVITTGMLIGGLFIYWASVAWSQIPEEAQYKEAVAFMDQNTTNTTPRCAFGSDVEIFRYYTDTRFEILNSFSDYKNFIATHEDFACIYHAARWNKQEMLEIAYQMGEIAHVVEFKKVAVYMHP